MGCTKSSQIHAFSLVLDTNTHVYDIQFNEDCYIIDAVIKPKIQTIINMLNNMSNLYKLTFLSKQNHIPIIFNGLLTESEHNTIIKAYHHFKNATTKNDILICLTFNIHSIYTKHKSIYQAASNFIDKTNELFWHVKYYQGIIEFYDLISRRSKHNIHDLSINTYNNEDSIYNWNRQLVRLQSS